MPENMMNSDHKATNDKYRDNYDRTFGKGKKQCDADSAETSKSTPDR